MGLLERWDARNQETLERHNREGNERWATLTTEWKVPWFHRAIVWWFFLGGVIGVAFGIVERDIARVALSAVGVMIGALDLAIWRMMRGDRR